MATFGAIQIQVTVDNKSFTFSKDHVVSLKVKRVMGDTANQFTLEVFDESAWQIENVLMNTELASISVKYSAADNLNNSIVFAGTCINYQVSFVGTATMLTIEGILSASSGDSSGWWFEKANIEWVGDYDLTNESVDGKDKSVYDNWENNEDVCAYIGYRPEDISKSNPIVYYNPSRIFKRIIHAYDGDKLGSNGPNAVEGWGTGGSGNFNIAECDESRWIASLDCRQTNETAAQYITRVLCKSAISWTRDGNGGEAKYEDETAGFMYFVDGNGHHFKKIDYSSKNATTIEITYGSRNSNIISFSIANIGSLIMAGGKNKVDASATSDLYGDIITINGENVAGVTVTEEQQQQNNQYLNWYFGSQSGDNKFKGVKVISSTSSTNLAARKDRTWEEIKDYTFNAELTVAGTYSNIYRPGNFINIILKDKDGHLHYASGKYMIISIDDNVSTTEFTQTMKLIKNTGNTVSATTYQISMKSEVKEQEGANSYTPSYTKSVPSSGTAYGQLQQERYNNMQNARNNGRI